MDLTQTLPGGSYPLERARHLADHLIWMRLAGRKDNTLFARRRAVVRLAEWLDQDPVDATFEQLEHWQRSLLVTSLNHVRSQTTLVRPFFAWMHQRGHRHDNPSVLLACPERPRGLPRPMSEDKATAAVDAADGRVRPWLLLAGCCGLRAAEIAGLRTSDFAVDTSGAVWMHITGKGDDERSVPVPPDVWAAITELWPVREGPLWRRERGFGPVLPRHVSQQCNRHLHQLGIPGTLHSLRHRWATELLEVSGDLRLVQIGLGHADPKTTQVYTLVRPRRLLAAVQALPALGTAAAPRHLHAVDTQEGTA